MPVLTTAPPHRYAVLEQQTGAVVGMLSDVDSDVRQATQLAPPSCLACKRSPQCRVPQVRLAAMQLLAKLQTSAIVDYASVVVQRYVDLVCALAACKCSPRRLVFPTDSRTRTRMCD
jgi:hypothetical protein